MDERYEVFCGLDVGKSEHHAAALNAAGERVFDKPLPQDEARLRELFTGLQQHGRVLVIVDQPNTIGALPIAVARDCGCTVAYLPGLAMRKAPTCTPESPRRTRGTHSSSPRPHGQCRTRCGPLTATAKCSRH